MPSGHLDILRQAVNARFHCESGYAGTSFVHEKSGIQTLWRGSVDCFELGGTGPPRKAFAWRVRDDAGADRIVIVSEDPDIKTPQDAVRAHFAKAAPAKRRPGRRG